MSAQGSPSGDPSPAHKTKKYDRQLRLWGDHGQSALEAGKVCLINATATGTEVLKNLVLPGIGAFTIVDKNKVSGEDAGNNFFLESSSIGKSRAEVATELLQELNEDVVGSFVEESTENLMSDNPEFFNSFTVVIATGLSEGVSLQLASHLWENGVPLMICRSYGFVGYIRLAVKEHTVIESHPDSAHEDLRLDQPFPGLVSYCDALNLDKMNKKDHSHTPWLVLIYKYLTKWKVEHNGEGPKNYREKNQLKEMMRQGIRTNEDGVPETEENFDEAIRNLNASLVPTQIPENVKKIFDDEACVNLTAQSKPFWILAAAVKEFVEKDGRGALTLRGSIPDMTADSDRYIQLQNVYRHQATDDMEIISQYVDNIVQSLNKPQDCITDRYINMFCKNASFLRIIRSRSLREEYSPNTAKTNSLALHLEDTEDGDIVFYVMLRAVDKFYSNYNRYPGCDQDTVESDIPKLKSCLTKLLQEYSMSQSIKDEYVHEFCRYGAAELHSVAAYIGGVAAQEVIKVMTKQFVPLDNTYIYNAMKQTSTSIEL